MKHIWLDSLAACDDVVQWAGVLPLLLHQQCAKRQLLMGRVAQGCFIILNICTHLACSIMHRTHALALFSAERGKQTVANMSQAANFMLTKK